MATLSDELLDLIKGLHATEEEVKQAKGKQEDLKKVNQSRFINMLNIILLIVMLSTVGNDVWQDVKNWKEILQKLEKLEQIDVEINKCFVKIAWGKAENKCQEVLVWIMLDRIIPTNPPTYVHLFSYIHT